METALIESRPAQSGSNTQYDAIVIGAGFAGMYMLYRLRQLGMRVCVYERGDDVGGTWYWNRYPGCRCDIESLSYSYSFSPELEQEWNWTERYAAQPEILEYAKHVADRFDLRRDIRFCMTVTAAMFDETSNQWEVISSDGTCARARFLISAVGCLSAGIVPDFPGLNEFKGSWYHTGNWPHEPVDPTGKRVGVIGTGSTGIQFSSAIAQSVGHLTIFQRTPNYSVPSCNAPLNPEELAEAKSNYRSIRAHCRYSKVGIPYVGNEKKAIEDTDRSRERNFEAAWNGAGFCFVLSYSDLLLDIKSNRTAAEFVERKIRETVKDPETAELLVPRGYPLGTKRLCVDAGYYQIFNQDNVSLVDVRTSPIESITTTGVRTLNKDYDLDVLVFATGYDAITGPLLRMDICGRNGRSLRRKWQGWPQSYLGLMMEGFPNLFTITGPGSPCVLVNMIVSIEQHVEWIADCIASMERDGKQTIEPDVEAECSWTDMVDEIANSTLYPLTDSWYTGKNVTGKSSRFTPYAGGMGPYRRYCEEIVEDGYRGFQFDRDLRQTQGAALNSPN
ncbi:flavin-containing monooxygenase [Methylibium petroleiphilum]|uniref:Cyclohexanone monooxygenase n=1 Tax=Methylibium petroleiphilum (strain ATCC BAA-1232 / LMG 22953 / PM1) TaxID=420662 RepID=A2SP56_METPP|nr:NAD(P)/FAD-dependent oxidoreductase [Methylibium petroleiphilum]ABM97345.1 Cyclohexanone monooxygenase [Methylibium petroleiphilum PM1]